MEQKDLLYKNNDYEIYIFQNKKMNNYTNDSLLLFNFIKINKKMHNILDLCSGNGPIPLLLSTITNEPILAIELQHDNVLLAQKSIKYNKLENQINIIEDNVININKKIGQNKYDLICANPPYYNYHNNANISPNHALCLARHEKELTFENLIKEVKTLLSNKGKFVFIHITERFNEILNILNEYNLYISRIQFIYNKKNKNSYRMLIEVCKNKNVKTIILPPLFRSEE